MWRTAKTVVRNPLVAWVKIFQSIFMGLLCLALFYGQDSYLESKSLISSLFFVIFVMILTNLFPSVLTFQNERPVYLREEANKLYTVIPYYFSKFIIELPVLAISPMIFSLIVYFGIGTTITASQFFYFYLVNFLVSDCT